MFSSYTKFSGVDNNTDNTRLLRTYETTPKYRLIVPTHEIGHCVGLIVIFVLMLTSLPVDGQPDYSHLHCINMETLPGLLFDLNYEDQYRYFKK